MYIIEKAGVSHSARVSQFVGKTFLESIALQYKKEGVKAFLNYVTPRQIGKRMRTDDDFFLIAKQDDEIIGMIEMSEWNHITLLFIKKEMRNEGIGSALINAAINYIEENGKIINEINLNAVSSAISAYEAMGFSRLGENTEKVGITYTPMKKIVNY